MRITPASRAGFFRTGKKRLVRLRDGAKAMSLRLTADHRVMRVARLSRYAMREGVVCGRRRCSPGELVVLNDHRARRQLGRTHLSAERRLSAGAA